MAKLSPRMEQYFRIKEQHKDHILFTVWASSMRCSMTNASGVQGLN